MGRNHSADLQITNLGEQGSSIHVEGGKKEKKNANKDMAETAIFFFFFFDKRNIIKSTNLVHRKYKRGTPKGEKKSTRKSL